MRKGNSYLFESFFYFHSYKFQVFDTTDYQSFNPSSKTVINTSFLLMTA